MGFSTFRRRDMQRFRKLYPRIRKTPRYFTISDASMSVESDRIEMSNEILSDSTDIDASEIVKYLGVFQMHRCQ